MNTYGERFRVTTYGESHGLAVGAVIDGCPAGVTLDMNAIREQLARRRYGAPRREEDEVEWLSGLQNGVTLGTPLAFLIRNKDARLDDYAPLEYLFRPGHADYTYYIKYGHHLTGGGRASARETVARVVAGSVARQLLKDITIEARPETETPPSDGETHGGIVCCRITGLKAGVGEPLFGKLNAQLAHAMMSIPSAIGFEMGAGFAAARMTGSEYIDRWNSSEVGGRSAELAIASNNSALTKTNHCGGVQGGISNGMPVEFRVAFHPVVSIPQPVECLHEDGHLETVHIGGRHDRYHINRAAVVVEAMAALCLINNIL